MDGDKRHCSFTKDVTPRLHDAKASVRCSFPQHVFELRAESPRMPNAGTIARPAVLAEGARRPTRGVFLKTRMAGGRPVQPLCDPNTRRQASCRSPAPRLGKFIHGMLASRARAGWQRSTRPAPGGAGQRRFEAKTRPVDHCQQAGGGDVVCRGDPRLDRARRLRSAAGAQGNSDVARSSSIELRPWNFG